MGYLVFARKTVTWRVAQIAKSLYGRDQENLVFRGDFARLGAKVRAQNGKLEHRRPYYNRTYRSPRLPAQAAMRVTHLKEHRKIVLTCHRTIAIILMEGLDGAKDYGK